MTNALTRLLFVAALALIAVGCSTNKSSKSPSAELVGRIDDQTADLVSNIQFDLRLADSIEINQYIDGNNPKTDDYLSGWQDMEDTLEVLVDYSLGLVDLAETRFPDNAAAIDELVTHLVVFETRLREIDSVAKFMPQETIASVAPEMREQKTMLKAFGQAGPLLDNYAEAVQLMTLDIEERFEAAFDELFDKIQVRHGTMLGFRSDVIARQNSAIVGLQLVDRAVAGDDAAWNELLASNWNARTTIGKGASATPANIRKVNDVLVEQLEEVNNLRLQLQLPYQAYTNQMKELYAIERQSRAVHKLAYLLAEDWAYSQRRLAQGYPGAFKKASSLLWKVAQKRLTG